MANRQSGVALITILLVVVIATVLGMSMVTEQKFAIARAASAFDYTKAKQYAYGGEEFARQILHQDFIDSPDTDYIGENWSAKNLSFEFEDGNVEFTIEDLQSKLNINALAIKSSQNQLAHSRLKILFQSQGLDATYIDRLKDWMDGDDNSSPLGAEDYIYLGLERPFRTAGQKFTDISELRLIYELNAEQYLSLIPFLNALPDPLVNININTAGPEVIQAVVPGLSYESAASIVSLRDEGEPFTSIADFTGQISLGDSANNIKSQGLSVQSSFFRVNIRARYHERFAYMSSIIFRDMTDGSLKIIYRNTSKNLSPVVTDNDAVPIKSKANRNNNNS